ncbi:hypothetical protein HDV00_001363 [Rhizophlyctis rosea]|nr:hypothetical protein HDV00_001363 [Rhizophlyctis rosea]
MFFVHDLVLIASAFVCAITAKPIAELANTRAKFAEGPPTTGPLIAIPVIPAQTVAPSPGEPPTVAVIAPTNVRRANRPIVLIDSPPAPIANVAILEPPRVITAQTGSNPTVVPPRTPGRIPVPSAVPGTPLEPTTPGTAITGPSPSNPIVSGSNPTVIPPSVPGGVAQPVRNTPIIVPPSVPIHISASSEYSQSGTLTFNANPVTNNCAQPFTIGPLNLNTSTTVSINSGQTTALSGTINSVNFVYIVYSNAIGSVPEYCSPAVQTGSFNILSGSSCSIDNCHAADVINPACTLEVNCMPEASGMNTAQTPATAINLPVSSSNPPVEAPALNPVP